MTRLHQNKGKQFYIQNISFCKKWLR